MITSKTEITSCIDWLSITRCESQYPSDWTKLKQEMPRGMHGYDTAVKYLDGRIELCSSIRKDMGVHTIISGDTISKICNMTKRDSFGILSSLGAGGCSRIDLAVDIKHGTLDIQKLWDSLENDKSETSATEYLHLRGGKGNGETLYIGGAKSKKRVRIYDKGAEQNVEYDWTRIEIQYRHKAAKQAVKLLLNSPVMHTEVSKMIVDFVNFGDCRDWVIALGKDAVKLGQPEPIASNRSEWLLRVAASALASEMIEGEGADFLDKFMDTTRSLYNKKAEKYK